MSRRIWSTTSPPCARPSGNCSTARPSSAIRPASWDATPKAALAEFLKQDPSGKLDQIYAKLIPNAPAIKQAEAKLDEAKRDLDAGRARLFATATS